MLIIYKIIISFYKIKEILFYINFKKDLNIFRILLKNRETKLTIKKVKI